MQQSKSYVQSCAYCDTDVRITLKSDTFVTPSGCLVCNAPIPKPNKRFSMPHVIIRNKKDIILQTRNPSNPQVQLRNYAVYISGPITGITDLNRPAFETAEQHVKSIGLDPINPHKLHSNPHAEWEEFMRVDIAALMECGLMVLLPGWILSTGACVEFVNAWIMGIPILTLDTLQYADPSETEWQQIWHNVQSKTIQNHKKLITSTI